MSLILKKEPFKPNTSKLNSAVNTSIAKSNLNKSLVDPKGGPTFQLSQQQIHFVNTELNEIYEVSMMIRNISSNKQQVRVKKPKSSCLSVSLSKDGPIAPGLDTKITVTYESKDNERLQDYFTILSDNFEQDVAIHIIPEAGKLQFEPFINFGFIKIGTTKEVTWKIANKSDTLTTIELNPSVSGNCELTIEPKKIMLDPKSQREIKIKITSQQVAHVEGTIEIEPKCFSVSNVDIVANFCEYTRYISDDEGQILSEISIGSVFAGESIELPANIVNNTPQSCEYRISRKKGRPTEESNSLITPQQFGKDDSQKLISFNPLQGVLEAYQSVSLLTKVQANFTEQDQQSFCNYILGRINNFNEEKQFSYTVKVHINEEENPLIMYLKGSSIIPKIGLSSTFLDFSDTFVNSKKERELKIENFSAKAANITLKNTSNFTFSQTSIRVGAKSNCTVTVRFCPKIVGQIHEITPLAQGDFSFPIKLIGKGVFNPRKNKPSKFTVGQSNPITTVRCEQMKVQELDNTLLENQISYIKGNENNHHKHSFLDEANKSTVHFDHSYTGTLDQSMNGNSIYITQHKKSRTLRDRNGKQVKITDSSSLNPNDQIAPYPSQPKNQQQDRTVNRELTSSELSNIEVGQVVLDIGKVYLRSTVKKTFHICNFNSKPISIQLNINNFECFSESLEERQILPPSSLGGLSIRFEALKEGGFKHNLQYIINGKHFFEIMLTGTVIQPTLNISRNEIKFYASQQDKTFEKKESFTLTNPYEYEVDFSILTYHESQLFKVEPENGKIPPKGSKIVSILHRFDMVQELGVKIEEIIKIKITHGKTLELKCLSLVPECTCVSKSQEINFKELAIGKSYENKITIKNTSKNFTIYKVIIPKDIENLVSVSSTSGHLHSEAIQEIVFKIQAFSSMNIDSSVTFLIRGGRPIVLPLKAAIITPKIKVENQKIDFGPTPTEGNPSVRTITLVNDSQITVDLEFRLAYESFLYQSLKISKILDENSQLIGCDENKGNKYLSHILRINPKCKTSISLEFTPEQVMNYEFALPLFVLNSCETIAELQRPCVCKGIKNRLMATEKEINFGKIIIEQNLESYQKNKIIEIKNPQQDPIEWWIDDSNILPFSLEKSRGKLEGFEKMNLKVFFYSDIEGEYTKELQFFISQPQKLAVTPKQSQANEEYLKITVKASACYPTLYFDQPYLILPVVNLGEQSKAAFQIINGGYENINIKHIVQQEFSNVDVKVNFLDGTNLGVTKKKIRVEVSFKSDKPISFTVKINFYDSSNRIFTIPVSGTADNCVYTNIYDEKATKAQLEQQIQKDCNFLAYYINSIGCLDDSLYEFPKSLAENQFEKLHQFLSNFSSAFEKVKTGLKKNDKGKKFFFNFDYLSEVIRIIKSEGGFLNQIRPEFLLASWQEYQQAVQIRAENNVNILANYVLMNEATFECEKKKAWVSFIYQIFKVYSRVNVGKTKNTEFWAKFSAKEKVVTNWLQQAYLSEAKVEYQKKNSILQELNDAELLSGLISKYTNIKILEVYGRQAKGIKEKERRIKNLTETFSQIGINCHCRVDDILRSNAKQMLLILEGLYLILPSYLQKGEPVLFSCALGQTITKSIEISNPSKHPIAYMAKIQGPTKAYVIENEQDFIIESKSTREIKIKYISNINLNNSTATLTLTGKASPKFTPSTFIFVLKSQNLGRVSEKNIQVTGQLYEQYEFGISVHNNFESEGDFKVEILNANANKESPLSFYCVSPSVKIRKNETITLNMMFIPLVLESQRCSIVFKDPRVGQFQYEITGSVQMPQLNLQVLKIPQSLLTSKRYSINLQIPLKNDNLSKARKIVESIVERAQKKSAKTQQSLITPEKLFPKVDTAAPYNVKIIPANEMVQLRNDTIFIKEGEEKVVQGSEQPPVKQEPKVGLEIYMKTAIKEGSFILLIRNQSGTDIRRYKVLLNSSFKPLKYELQMKTPVNKSIAHKLPLININAESNTFYLSMLTNEASKGIFLLEREKQLIVAGTQTQNITLSFRPKSQQVYNALVKMQNQTTGQIVEYEIRGTGEEPNSQVLTFDQEIRQQKLHQIRLPIDRAVKCVVSKFTLDDAIYEKSFIANGTNNSTFKFKFTAKIPGTYQGRLLVEDDTKVYAYKVVINALDLIEQEIMVKTIERKVYKSEILNVPEGKYEVTCANTCLKFNKNFVSTVENKGKFDFEHYSTKPEEVQSFLVFNNEKIGQVTYLLKIKVEEMPEVKFEPFKTELGSRHQEIIKFENKQSTPLKITGKCTQLNIFFFEPTNIVVPPRSQLTAKLIYCPSKLELEEGKVSFMSERGQKWNYHMSGYGLVQSKPTVIQMRGYVGTDKIESISFVNPLQQRIQAFIELQNLDEPFSTEGQSQVERDPATKPFQLILKGHKFELDYQQQLILPILLKLQSVTVKRALLTVTVSQKMIFRYELVGVAEYLFKDQKMFRLQAKTKKEETVTFDLPFLEQSQKKILEKAKIKITPVSQVKEHLLKDSIKIVQKEGGNVIDGNKISFDIVLRAHKPFKTQAYFLVQLPNGCRWIQKYDINFTQPSVDDKIDMVAEMNKPTTMAFKLPNRVKSHAPFKAYFVPSASNEFSISPRIGQLEPLGREGTPFEITFLPTVYKKEWQGKMVIETEDSYWSYEVKGMLPLYLPPIAKSLISNGSTSKLKMTLEKANTNMKKSA